MLPKPVTQYSDRTSPRVRINELYKERILQDGNMGDVNSLIDYGKTVFSNLDGLIDLTDLDAIKTSITNMVLPKGFVPINQTATDFYLKVKPHNGMIALRRGFYQLIPEAKLVPVMDYSVWRMDVLFNEGPSSDIIYRYTCNVGPLVNKFAVCRNLTIKQFIGIDNKRKEEFLRNLENQTIYVSSSELVHVEGGISYDTKEVLWFKW